MAAFLKRWFKPGKKHSESDTKAIAALDPQKEKDLQSLLQAATASDEEVRRLAIGRIDRLDKLVALYADTQSAERTAISERINKLAKDTQRLNEARKAIRDPQLRQILDQLTGTPGGDTTVISAELGPDRLEQLAIEGKTARERQSAVDLVEDEERLQRIARAAKGRDKNAYQTARKKLQKMRQAAEERASQTTQVQKVLDSLKQHASTESNQLYRPRLEALRQQWSEVDTWATAEQHEQALSAIAECEMRARELLRLDELEAEETRKREEREQTLDLLQKTLDDLAHPDGQQNVSLSSLDALQKTQENRWMEATRDAQVDKQEQKSYERLMQGLRLYIDAVRRLDASRDSLQKALDDAGESPGALKSLVNDIDWPSSYPMPELLHKAHQALGDSRHRAKEAQQDVKATEAQLVELLDKLEDSLEQDVYKRSRRLLKEAQHILDKLPHQSQHHHQGRFGLLAGRVKELGDWRGFATRPKQEELCEHMEYLAGQHMDPEAKAARIKELQHEWRQLGGSSDQSLWQRFKQAADEAFAPCQEYFDARNDLKQANLARRETICDELETFIDSVDWENCDWKGVERIHRQAREEWRNAKPVDYKAGRPVQKRFDRLLKTLDHHLDQEKERNEALKADIVKRAEALIDHEPLQEATQAAKDLQREWQAVGITHHRKDREMWSAFRRACDAIFARRDQARQEHKAAMADAESRAEALLKELAELAASQGPDAQAMARIKSAFNALELPRKSQSELKQRFQDLEGKVHGMVEQLKLEERVARWVEKIDSVTLGDTASTTLRDATIRAEIAAGVESPERDRERRMALQVERLSAGLSQGQPWESALEQMDGIVGQWVEAATGGQATAEDKERVIGAFQALRSTPEKH